MPLILLLALLAGCGKLYIKQRAPLVVDHNVHVMSREELEIWARLFCRNKYQYLPESGSKDVLVEQCVDAEVEKILEGN